MAEQQTKPDIELFSTVELIEELARRSSSLVFASVPLINPDNFKFKLLGRKLEVMGLAQFVNARAFGHLQQQE